MKPVSFLQSIRYALESFKVIDFSAAFPNKNSQLSSMASSWSFIESIAVTIQRNIISLVSLSPLLTLHLDESSDVSKARIMLIYIRLLHHNTFRTVLFDVVRINSQTGESLFNYVSQSFFL